MELALWETVKDSRSPEELKVYLDQYPEGRFAGVARVRLKTLTAAAAPAVAPTTSTPPQQVALAEPSTLTFKRDPGTGLDVAVEMGDPRKPGPFVIRLRTKAGWRDTPHTHANDLHVTVMSGVVRYGEGEQFVESALRDYPAGNSVVISANVPHYMVTTVSTEFQLQGVGPLATRFVTPQKHKKAFIQP